MAVDRVMEERLIELLHQYWENRTIIPVPNSNGYIVKRMGNRWKFIENIMGNDRCINGEEYVKVLKYMIQYTHEERVANLAIFQDIHYITDEWTPE